MSSSSTDMIRDQSNIQQLPQQFHQEPTGHIKPINSGIDEKVNELCTDVIKRPEPTSSSSSSSPLSTPVDSRNDFSKLTQGTGIHNIMIEYLNKPEWEKLKAEEPSILAHPRDRAQMAMSFAKTIITEGEVKVAHGDSPVDGEVAAQTFAIERMLGEVGMTLEDLFDLKDNYNVTSEDIKKDGGLKRFLELEINALKQFITAFDASTDVDIQNEYPKDAKGDRIDNSKLFEYLKFYHKEMPSMLDKMAGINSNQSTFSLNESSYKANRFPCKLPNLPKITHLLINHEIISSIKCLSAFSNLNYLYLTLPLSSFPEEISSLMHLNELHIEGNGTALSIPQEFSECTNLTKITLRNCDLKSFPPVPINVTYLDILTNPNMQISSSNSLPPLDKLTHIVTDVDSEQDGEKIVDEATRKILSDLVDKCSLPSNYDFSHS